MISLTNNSSTTTTKLQAFLSGAAATTNPTVTVVSYIVPPQSKPDYAEYRRAPQFTVLAGATETDIADAPPSGSVKDIIYISIYNADTAAVTVTVCIDDNATNRILCKVTLGVGYTLYYEDDRGWYVIDSAGGEVVSAPVTLAQGTYTPTLTSVANVAASTQYVATYSRVGNMVSVAAKVDIDPTAAATLTRIGISLPIASNLATSNQLCGGGQGPGDTGAATMYGAVYGDTANDRAEYSYTSDAGGGNNGHFINFSYLVI